MPYGLYLSADGARAQSRRLDVLANNLANANTTGFKRQLAIFQARYAEADQRGQDRLGSGSLNDLGGGVFVSQTKTDFSPAAMKRTGEPTDLAIDGEGFFLVRKDNDQYLTRAGNFHLNAHGELVTAQEYPVLNDTGTPVTIDLDAGPWSVTSSGGIRQAGGTQSLALVKTASMGDLVKCGNNLFRPLSEPQPVAAAERRVSSGFLETSGVEPTTEMVDLIETQRAFEANVNMMQTQDEMLSALISRVLTA
jgi:flagellar basal-body rod protein FlgF/flagellar basal-body rod protein FlgG